MIRIISWNIWQGYHLEKIVSFLQSYNADIIALQEVIEKEGTNTAAIIAEKLSYHYTYFRATDKTRLGFPQGNAILSAHPINKSTFHLLNNTIKYNNRAETEPRIAVEAQITIHKVPTTIFTTHLSYSHMFQESLIRNIQIGNVIKLLPPTHTILMGDFNSHPDSTGIRKLSRVMQNADNSLSAPTWTMYPFSYEGFIETQLRHRLDYIFVTPDIHVVSTDIPKSTGSDHLPVTAVLRI